MKIIQRLVCLIKGHDSIILIVNAQDDSYISCSRCTKRKAIWKNFLMKK